ncbi:hypothetical protein HHI36_021847 [Cryptolaemus montrouzieri]|uniref:THAP-type domain-containing protein n=1 Tax=Cryptolaemus montrouzieri TaxID=559131 RepID=A0ABD2MXY5_9CUCU
MPSCCACNSRTRCKKNQIQTEKVKSVTYHRFPINFDRRVAWVRALKKPNWEPSPTSVVCSAHFEEHHFDRTSLSCVRLRETAIPAINLKRISHKLEPNQ